MKPETRIAIDKALFDFQNGIRAKKGMLNAQKVYINYGVQQAVETLITYAKLAREGHEIASVDLPKTNELGEPVIYGSYRSVASVEDTYIAAGQRFSSLLFGWGLRDSIVDKIENAYGVSFSGLKVYPAAKHKNTGKIVYVLFYQKDSREWGGHTKNVTLSRDEENIGMSREEFEKDYEFLKY